MSQQKLYAGVKIREIRTRIGLTQKEFSYKLNVSLPYFNQMENNNRPISTGVMLSLAQEFGLDITEFSTGDSERMLTDMREAFTDPVFSDLTPPDADLRLSASNAPNFTKAFLNLHRAYRHLHDRLASFDEALGQENTNIEPSPWEEVRDFFHYRDNYIDPIDKAAELFSKSLKSDILISQYPNLNIKYTSMDPLRRFEEDTKTLYISTRSTPSTQRFQIFHQISLIKYNALLETTLDAAKFRTDAARMIAKIGLANYFAGAAMLPYEAFLEAAQKSRHDLEELSYSFGASIEQIAHRLSTLQRPGKKGVPFFFVRVDQAGTITKRHSATRLQFARFGGACPLWNVHRAFETPGRLLRQLAETPDGVRYISLAQSVSKPGGSFNSPTRRYAIAIGCEISYSEAIVYADDLVPASPKAFEPIGISCRICTRTDCHQRSVPALESRLKVDHNIRKTLPYILEN